MGSRATTTSWAVATRANTPERVYLRPKNRFVAGFMGSLAMNVVSARLARGEGGVTAGFGEHRIAIGDDVIGDRPGLFAPEGHVLLGIRPEDLEDAEFAAEAPPETTITTTCTLREALGSEMLLHIPIATAATQDSDPTEPIEPGGGASTACVAHVHPESRVREGDRLRLVLDTKRLHFFDPESGLAYLP